LAQLNTSTDTYVAWNWKANGAGSSNTDGTITSTVSVNTTSGFSIATYTGNGSTGTFGHGLGVAPKMAIVRQRDVTGNSWLVYHVVIGAGNFVALNLNSASTPNTDIWNNTAPTTSVFNVGAASATNDSGGSYLALLFAEIEGYSKINSYVGNGSADGPFVYCGFRPAWLMVKRTDTTDNWFLVDVARSPVNVMGDLLLANSNGAEFLSNHFDFTANGFKLRNTGAGLNASGGTYIFMALASNPFKYSLAR
jgi:hypothetical protein